MEAGDASGHRLLGFGLDVRDVWIWGGLVRRRRRTRQVLAHAHAGRAGGSCVAVAVVWAMDGCGNGESWMDVKKAKSFR